MKKAFYGITLLLIAGIAFIGYTNWRIRSAAEGKLYSSISEIPKNRVGLLLGTSNYLKGGGVNPFFKNRIDAAVALFKAGKIEYILVSGDNRHVSYNEPRDLKNALLKRGIPDNKIVLDFAGFRTLDSVVRAHLVFGQDHITIISQKFHNQRALYIAQNNDLQAIGFNAEDPENWSKVYWRELFAKTKSYLDILTNKRPKFLGESISIE